ncbi:DUF397 domain-containing protein [Streptomyces sp. NBC_00996]|uniref:DUF397 domain-containing protein n=1 Tax=Streptomyces sp. NBC_00996 TaxID=2903710 RepID=UPI003867D127|nr:DUF397 domain-containing protein [Streptomyces sp. NBC_00996]
MSELNWQKSTYSGGPQGECVNVATAPDGTIRLRESDTPRTVIATAPEGLAALLRHLKTYT